jgi:thiol-disulfide isomerase/thioredoxin
MPVVAALIASAFLLTGCSTDPLAEQYKEGSNKGYIAGDGSVTEIAEADRGEAISFAGTADNGEEVSSENYAGEVLVVNFWYAACAPCRAEAPVLQELSTEYDGQKAQFVGVNVYDQADTAQSFNDKYGITYPSIMDVQDGAVKLAFTGTVPPKAVPTTLVLDKEGRVAARILGQVKEASILDTLIRDAIAE